MVDYDGTICASLIQDKNSGKMYLGQKWTKFKTQKLHKNYVEENNMCS